MKKIITSSLLVMILAVISITNVFASDLEYSKKEYIDVVTELNEIYDVDIVFYNEYTDSGLSPDELRVYLESFLGDVYREEIQIDSRLKNQAATVFKTFPIEATVTYGFNYSNNYFTKCINVTSKTSTSAILSNASFLQDSYSGSVIDGGRTLAVSIYGTYINSSGIAPIKINNYKISFELYYSNL